MKNMKKDEKAVSPVLGVILMVAITVIIAAVVAAFVFGIGTPTKAPQASLAARVCATCNGGGVGLTIEHQGGDAIALANTQVVFIPDASNPGVSNALGTLVDAPSAGELGSNLALETGETSDYMTATGAIPSITAEVKIIDSPTGKLILDTKVLTTA